MNIPEATIEAIMRQHLAEERAEGDELARKYGVYVWMVVGIAYGVFGALLYFSSIGVF